MNSPERLYRRAVFVPDNKSCFQKHYAKVTLPDGLVPVGPNLPLKFMVGYVDFEILQSNSQRGLETF